MGSKKAEAAMVAPERDRQLRAGCAKFLSHHRQKSVRETLTTLARHPLAEQLPDVYGSGGAVGELERRVVALLGKQAGVFFAKGVIAQECVARAYSEQRGSPYVALSPLGHIDSDEANGVEYLHNLRLVRLGRYALFALTDLQRVLGGCVVAGTRDCIHALEVWRTRQGAALWTAYPYALSALDGLDRHLSRMPDYVRRARGLAARLRDERGCEIHPLAPHTNAFQVILRGTVDELRQRTRDFATREKVWLFNAFFESPFEGKAIAEIVVGDAADDYSDDEACRWLRRFQTLSDTGRRQSAVDRAAQKPAARRLRKRRA